MYQLMMDAKLPFNYRAITSEEYNQEAFENQVTFNKMYRDRKEKIIFNEHKFQPYEFPKTQRNVLFYAVDAERLDELLEHNPKAEEIFSDYCVGQTKYLRKTRMKAEHLSKVKRKDFDYFTFGNKKRNLRFLNKELNPYDLDFEILEEREPTTEEKISDSVKLVNKLMNKLKKSLDSTAKLKPN